MTYLKSSMINRVQPPVLVFGQNLVNLERFLPNLAICTRRGLESGFYNDLLLVDRSGAALRTVGARKIRTLPPRLGVGSLLGYLEGNPRYEVELVFSPEPPSKKSLDEIKKLIYDSFAKERSSWAAMSDFEDFRTAVRTAESFEELFSAFDKYHV
jgi:hypothetical protein